MGNALFFPGSFPIGEGVSEKYDIVKTLLFTNLDRYQSNPCQLRLGELVASQALQEDRTLVSSDPLLPLHS